MTNEDVYCSLCGLFLGAGFPGGSAYCSRCGESVVAKSSQGNVSGAVGGLIALGIGIGVAALFVGLINAIFNSE